jgi:hypothetical protein
MSPLDGAFNEQPVIARSGLGFANINSVVERVDDAHRPVCVSGSRKQFDAQDA